jgi:hypothetical protein
MRVAINFCSTTPQNLEVLAWWQTIGNEMAVQHPEHQFYFIVNAENVSSPKKDNLQEIVVNTNPSGHFLKTIYWCGIALPALIKKLKVDVVVHPFGEFMVQKALEYKLGARGLRSICEGILTDAMFELPSKKVTEFNVTLEYAENKFSITKMGILKVA